MCYLALMHFVQVVLLNGIRDLGVTFDIFRRQKVEQSCPVCRSQTIVDGTGQLWILTEAVTRDSSSMEYERKVVQYYFKYINEHPRPAFNINSNRAALIISGWVSPK